MIALNYIYLSEKHAGGKDQVGFNLLKGFEELKLTDKMVVICFDFSEEIVKSYAPSIKVITIPGKSIKSEIKRMMYLCYVNTFVIPKIIKENGIDLIYHLSCNTGLRKLPCKSVVIPHDIKAVSHRVLANVKVPYYKYIVNKVMYAVDFKNNDAIIAISDTDKSEISEFYPKHANKVRRIYDPIIVAEAKDKSKVYDYNYICAINLQFHHKNTITLIKAFELIKDETDVNLVLIGSVPDRVSYLKEYVAEHGLTDRVVFTGFTEDSKLKRLLINSALYVNPTLYEGFGMPPLEAMACGTPVLTSNAASLPEAVGKAAILVNPYQVEAIEYGLEQLMTRPKLRAKMKQLGLARAEQMSWENAAEKLFSIYETLG